MRSSNEYISLLGANIKAARTVLGFSQREIAKLAGISLSYYSQIEAGKRIPSLEVLINISEALKVSPDNLVYGEKMTRHQDIILQMLAGLSDAELIRTDQILRTINQSSLS